MKKIAPKAPSKILEDNLGAFNQGLRRFGITTCREKAHFFAQIYHETGGMRLMKENGGETMWYNPWYGREFIQLSRIENYQAYEKFIKEDVTSSPQARDKLLSPPHSVLSVFWFYRLCINSGKNDDFNKVTAIINGGFTGYDDRLKHLKRIIDILRAEHLNQLLGDGKFEFTHSSIYDNRVNSLAWGLWHDPTTKKKGTVKDKNEALKGYERTQQLIMEKPYKTSQKDNKIYGIKYSDVLTYVNKKIILLKGN
ncbi:glycoside hydrolase family 19 protein [Xenorhabdus griffiniae]|uniref:Uncharacterized protein n=1 Tax=Xenorhabdus griffiniae TaxID=351672 RepID=A0ABY9XGD2_9GAMM|nr:hypothetical protein [Xenorhabdus griffiniae]MBD1228732.1 hypothetical protein [Xenorhabdus griffiniae]MBE8587383.1 hypothetical protein [Xenorhabdus griffiniae]WMV71992.1 hypothetical protein QL128_18035 [Xenorhabdus griffiniae]WNH01669.1 hypothetical protein QL112_018040 [Xenorhabdus griffiniae]